VAKEFTLDREKADMFLEAMRRRYACKHFDRNVRLSAPVIEYILECGRLSPSSFGLEPWRFVVVTDDAGIKTLGDACFAQDPAYTCSAAVVILVRRESAYSLDAEFIGQRARRFPGGYPVFADDYRAYHEFLETEGRILHWARAQSYIACANMMTGAAAIGLDSCPLEGFDEGKVLSALGKDAEYWTVGIVVAFGIGDGEIRPKIREEAENISEFMHPRR